MSMADVADELEPLADDARELFFVGPGWVRLRSGPRHSVLVLLPGTVEPAVSVPDGEIVEGLVAVDDLHEGRVFAGEIAARLGLDEAQVTFLDKKAPRKQRFGDRLELGALTLLREHKRTAALRAFWFGTDGTLMIGARLPLDAWLSTPFPTHVAGTLAPPSSAKEIARLERAAENDAWAYVRSVTLVRDAVGFSADPFASRLPGFGVETKIV